MKSSMTRIGWSWIRSAVEYMLFLAAIALMIIATLNSGGN
jgi:hypothetical protein